MEDFAEMLRQAEARMGVQHRGGVAWHASPLPPRFHRCWAQTSGPGIERCPCGAARMEGFGGWADRNSARRSWFRMIKDGLKA